MDINTVIQLKDSSLYDKLPAHGKACLWFERGALNLCLADGDTQKVLAFERWQIRGKKQVFSKQIIDLIDWLINDYPWLAAENIDMSVVFNVYRHGLVPLAFFEPSQKESYLSMHDPGQEAGDWVYHENLEQLEAVLLYSLPLAVESRIRSAFPKARIMHSKSVLLSTLLLPPGEPAPIDLAAVYAGDDFLEMLVVVDGKLQFFNEFRWENKDDLAYHILNAMDKCSLPAVSTPLKIMGPAWAEEGLVLHLQQFIPAMTPMNVPAGFSFSNAFGKAPKHTLLPFINALT